MIKNTVVLRSQRWRDQIGHVQRQLASPEPIRRQQLAEAFAALEEALAQVETAEETLSLQNEELTAVREELEIERHRYAELFQQAPIGYLVTDGSGAIREANQAATVLLNTSQKALKGKPLLVFLQPSNRGDFREMLRDLRKTSAVRELEIVVQPRDASPRRVHLKGVRDEAEAGRPVLLHWILQDVSERRAAERALRESQENLLHARPLEAIGRLAGGVAHSFNNLLAGIAVHAELILDDRSATQDVKRHAEGIQHAGEQSAALAHQLLTVSRKQALRLEPLNLSRLITGMEPMLQPLLGKNVKLVLAIDPDAGRVSVDPDKLEQVFLNLLSNARDAMPHGGQLTIRTEGVTLDAGDSLRLPPGDYVLLSIIDSGLGMDREVLAHLSEPFFTTKGRGTGLGLFTVAEIIHQSGGEIRVESAPGKGSTFEILLPRVEEPVESAAG